MTYIVTKTDEVDEDDEDDDGAGEDLNGNFNWLHRFSSLKKINLIIEDLDWDSVYPIKLESYTIGILTICRDDRNAVLLNMPKLRELWIGDNLYRHREDMGKLENLQFIA
ncbi:unnamed protein product [Ambrosiozyma monospora]|uniref:Unnamed protein product n=1 Tax=Ambrosiozyma monospora TaxID=43982 RepID=A0ACB5T6M3_AMBMO|nr:unnamed protein product [Ambrosiozyma monospora]